MAVKFKIYWYISDVFSTVLSLMRNCEKRMACHFHFKAGTKTGHWLK